MCRRCFRLNIYLQHLKKRLNEHKLNTIKQSGKSDIDPYDYSLRSEKWYGQICELIEKNKPIDYVSSIRVLQDSVDNIVEVSYVYCTDNAAISNLSIDIFWI